MLLFPATLPTYQSGVQTVNKAYWCQFAFYLTTFKKFKYLESFSSCSVIVRVSVVLKRTVGDSD